MSDERVGINFMLSTYSKKEDEARRAKFLIKGVAIDFLQERVLKKRPLVLYAIDMLEKIYSDQELLNLITTYLKNKKQNDNPITTAPVRSKELQEQEDEFDVEVKEGQGEDMMGLGGFLED